LQTVLGMQLLLSVLRIRSACFRAASCLPADEQVSEAGSRRDRHWRWHLDEMYVKLHGQMVYLWQVVD